MADALAVEPFILAPRVAGFLAWRGIRSVDAGRAWTCREQPVPAVLALGD